MDECMVRVKGCFRLQILNPDGAIAGDSGIGPDGQLLNGDGTRWNMIPNDGFNKFICDVLAGSAASLVVGSIALGSGGAPASNTTQLPSEIGSRTAFSASTSAATHAGSTQSSHYVAYYATFPAGWHTSVGAGYNISNIGLYNGSASAGTLFAGNTYASSGCASNQAVQCSYYINFNTA
jgi:hypothetical protein